MVYEQICPQDAFGKFMIQHFKNIGSPINGIHYFRNTTEQKERYLKNSWTACKTFTLTDVFRNLPREEIERLRKIEMFDEFEEFILKSSHYLVICATKGSLENFGKFIEEKQKSISTDIIERTTFNCNLRLVGNAVECDLEINRFGHSATLLDNKIFIVGGFGEQEGLPQIPFKI